MTTSRSPEERISRWLEEEAVGPLPDRVLNATFETTRAVRQARTSAWRPFTMSRPIPAMVAVGAAAIVIAAGVIYLRPFPSNMGGSGPPMPSPTASATAAASTSPSHAGTITLTDTGCTWESNPGSLTSPDLLAIALRNETAHYADFQLHWLRNGRSYAEGVAFVDELARRLTTGEEWPPNDVSIVVHSQGAAARSESFANWLTEGIGDAPTPELQNGPSWNLATGTYGVVCSANTSPTGEVLTTFLVGPLQLSFIPQPSESSSAQPSPSP